MCKDAIDWATQEKRIFLRQSLETRMIALYVVLPRLIPKRYLENKMYSDALALITNLLRELKKLDDKASLLEVQLLESYLYLSLRNIPKSKAALTSARTSANAIYVGQAVQAGLDMQSGILHAEEGDYKTAFSYFYETFEGYNSLEDPRAEKALKYMLLCKVMLKQSEDVFSLISGKVALKYSSPAIEALKAIATANQNRSLGEFEEALKKYKDELGGDIVVRGHLASLYDGLLEANLARVIEPFEKVEIAHVAGLVKLPTTQVEAKYVCAF